ncbi:MAG: DR2241 family protein, partial [Natrinema limicola]
AVAEGRTDEIREADVYDGANRYRARYLRAKRVGEDGLEATQVDE